jgi:hypothetical protein
MFLLKMVEIEHKSLEQGTHLLLITPKIPELYASGSFLDHQVVVNDEADPEREVVCSIVSVELDSAEITAGYPHVGNSIKLPVETMYPAPNI